MVMTDPIADMLTRIRNANMVRHEKLEVPASKIKKEIAEILKSRLYPGIEIENISLGSRPFIEKKKKGSYYNKNNNRNKKDLISKIEITLKTKSYM